ncbi:hypothetical protein Glove_216g52 [Diversispora epigaea]|uniref:Uncharacterized protein n=1 Tax=Diversispora epigaea TaxID=1348612 RepID=A0A397IQL7_9GLOM|nr:hypothetical protein Glove_216g52 [Diversispora epigaea]
MSVSSLPEWQTLRAQWRVPFVCSSNCWEVIEWIPYDRIKYFKQIANPESTNIQLIMGVIDPLLKNYIKYHDDYRDYLRVKIQKLISASQESTNTTTTTPLNYQIYPQAIYTSCLLNHSSLPKPKNEENFERN